MRVIIYCSLFNKKHSLYEIGEKGKQERESIERKCRAANFNVELIPCFEDNYFNIFDKNYNLLLYMK